MKVIALFWYCAIIVLGCARGPVFDARADHEEGHDRPCYIHGQLQPGWHQCQMRDTDACCPDGASCSGDDFVPNPRSYCRWWGTTGAQ